MKKSIKRLQGSSYVISLEKADLLGQGSFGRVVRAYDLENRDEALVAKIMEIGTQTKLDCLQSELNVLESLDSEHQNLVRYKRKKLYSQKACYIIMEYCNGGTLEDKMKNKIFSEQEIFDFLSQFCSGYRELLQQGIIHRGKFKCQIDLKPANIMIHDRLYKITDFGLAKIVNTLIDKLTISFKGTPLYMAPEMIQEEAVADAKIDMWGLGVILYRMLYGSFPFLIQNKKYDRERAFEDIVKNPLKIPLFPKRSKEIIEIVTKMLEKKPKDRISWEQLFSHPKIRLIENESQIPFEEKNQGKKQKMMNSSLFIQQMITQKVSLIKVKPFKEKIKKPQVQQFLTNDMLQMQVKNTDEEQKIILDKMIGDLNSKLVSQRQIHQIEDKLLYFREFIFFLDKTALRIYRLNIELDEQIQINLSSNLIEQAIQSAQNLQALSPLDKLEQQTFKQCECFDIFQQMLQQDIVGLIDFREELAAKMTTRIKESFNLFKEYIKNNQKQVNRQIYIAIKYLTDSQKFEALGFKQYDQFWLYYEEVENIQEEEVQDMINKIK